MSHTKAESISDSNQQNAAEIKTMRSCDFRPTMVAKSMRGIPKPNSTQPVAMDAVMVLVLFCVCCFRDDTISKPQLQEG